MGINLKNKKLKIRLVYIFLVICCGQLFAQDYQTVISDRVAYFADKSGDVQCIRIDSARYLADSVFYPFSNIRMSGYDCFTPYGASWTGHKIIIQSDGFNIFFNKELDTVRINTNASLHEKWLVYGSGDPEIIFAEVVKHDTLQFLGQTDSVKTIEFQVFDRSMRPVSHCLDTMSVLLSKNYGMIKTLNFYLFPDFDTPYYPLYDRLQEYDLAGLSHPQIGIQNLTWFEVHDFQSGDEIHILYESTDQGTGHYFADKGKFIFKYLERLDFPDSIVYMIEKTSSFENIRNNSSTLKYFHDTVENVIKRNPSFDKLPGEPIIANEQAFTYWMKTGSDLSKTLPACSEIRGSSISGCWYIRTCDGCFPSYTYIKGLGGPYYECTNAFSMGGTKNELVYYKKGQLSWGTPLIITGISDDLSESEIEIYPNPADDFIRLKANSQDIPVTFELIDPHGRILLIEEICSEYWSINISYYPAGLYFYRVRNKNGMVSSGKLMIK